MLKNYWHFAAFSVLVALFMKISGQMLGGIIFCLWVFLLVLFKRMQLAQAVFFICSLVFFYSYLPPHSSSELPLLHKPIPNYQLQGKIVSEVTITDDYVQFVLKEDESKRNILVHLFINEELPLASQLQLQHGAICEMIGTFKLPEAATNPYQFDYRDYLFKKGITYQLELKNSNDIVCHTHSALQKLYSLRFYFLTKTKDTLHEDIVKWLQALVLGHDYLLDEETIDLFQRWNLSHILAISGLHIGIITGFIYFLLIQIFQFTKENTEWIIMTFLPVYAVIAGGEPSVWRASMMVLFLIILRKTRIKLNMIDIISIVFILLVIYDRNLIFHVGFQFSFAVTFCLVLSRKWIERTQSNVLRILQISFIAQMSVLPLQIHYFYTFQPLSILVNLIVVPYFSLFVIPLMFFLFIGFALPKFFLKIIENIFLPIHESVLKGLAWIDHLLNNPLILGEIPIQFVVLYYLFFILIMRFIEENKLTIAFRYGLLLSFLIIFLSVRFYFSPLGTVTVLDIGQGDCIVIELPYRKGVFLIDAGATFSFSDKEPSKRIYKQIIRPYLFGRGIHQIDAIFVTHEDLDHAGSVSFLLKEFSVQEIVVSEFFQNEVITEWKKLGANISIVRYNDVITRANHRFQVLAPYENYQSPNENSLVLYSEFGKKTWIFLGDIDKERERRIVSQFPHLTVDVVKIAHHGSKTSTDRQFIRKIQPLYALISVGRNNRYNHPSNEVVQTLVEEEITIFRTDEHGAVQFTFTGFDDSFKPFIK